MREYGTGLYSAEVYYLSKTIVEVVYHVTVTFILLFTNLIHKHLSKPKNRQTDTQFFGKIMLYSMDKVLKYDTMNMFYF